ncbi:MAG TPA: 2-oxoglutarate dehydrogenase E1 component [Saprospiraceae bacterium]|nr:2-oxoglutarate dehydrogenase E1 component [Saprospiraceae bacterium]
MQDDLTFLGAAHSQVIEELYQQYKTNPDSVDYGWRKFFEGFDFRQTDYNEEQAVVPERMHKEFQVINLINGYRFRGHLFTKTNPVRNRRTYTPTLDIENFGLAQADLHTVFQAGEVIGIGPATLSEIIKQLTRIYCQSIGVEYMYIRDPKRVKWLQERIETKEPATFSPAQKLKLHDILNKAVIFEQFLQKKFVGQKRFSVEGGEVLIPALEKLVEEAVNSGTKEFVFGMAHRGRLNTIAHIFEKPYNQIFDEFYGKGYDDDDSFDGDVKYHLGYTKKIKTKNNHQIKMTLCPNPSHLEAVGAVAEGLSRAKLDLKLNDEKEMLPIIIHGDAAIAGQGLIYEVVQMAGLDGYRTGGTIHIVVNNQVGFTTNYLDARTSTYCTDVGKVSLSPIFHVNADDIEAVATVIELAVAYRQNFHKDVFIDLLGYRKYGHNEGDEPKFTQPKLYKTIAKHPDLLTIYSKKLEQEGVLSTALAQKKKADLEEYLNEKFELSKTTQNAVIQNFMHEEWAGFKIPKLADFDKKVNTSFNRKKLEALAQKLFTLPEDIHFFRKIKKLMQDRLKMIQNNQLDWGTAETLAYATLLAEGHPVRISGQDVERGTFSHRHGVLKAEDTEQEYYPLKNISDEQGAFHIYNSPLSEYGVLGFEYGYAFGVPNGLTIWEAQFGDFFNGAQILIDQFISSAADKWKAMNGLVMLLPHGYEGMGSEHSSGRIERFLQQCAEANMQVCNTTTPANFYHLLRTQLKRHFRVPLIVFTPKKLLRYPKAISTMDELAIGHFQPVIDDLSAKTKDIDTVILCSGKIYYDLLEEKEKRNKGQNIAIIRVEQLYPLPEKELNKIVKKYTKNAQYIWVQEEPANMGAWSYMLLNYHLTPLTVIARPGSGSPASGSKEVFEKRQKTIFDHVFAHAK